MSIYARTEEGQWAAYNAQSTLPRKLKSLLRVIDGKTATRMYVENLKAYGDVAVLLTSLESAGLIKRVPAGLVSRVKLNVDMPSEERQRLKQTASGVADWAATEMASRSGDFVQTTPKRNPLAWGFAATTQLQTQLDESSRGESAALTKAVDLISDYVHAHLPGSENDVLSELKNLTSLEDLAVMLGGYEQLVSDSGPASVGHVREIKTILKQNL